MKSHEGKESWQRLNNLKVKRRKEDSSDEEEESTQNTNDGVQNAANVASEIKSDQGEANKTWWVSDMGARKNEDVPFLFCAKDFREKLSY